MGKHFTQDTVITSKQRKQIYKVTITFFAVIAPKKEEHGYGCLLGP